jgi:hypothetical protein
VLAVDGLHSELVAVEKGDVVGGALMLTRRWARPVDNLKCSRSSTSTSSYIWLI